MKNKSRIVTTFSELGKRPSPDPSARPPTRLSRYTHLAMAFEFVRRIFGQGTPPNSRAHEPTMENDSLGDQQGNTLHGIRDVMESADFNWSELARAPQYEVNGRGHYTPSRGFWGMACLKL